MQQVDGGGDAAAAARARAAEEARRRAAEEAARRAAAEAARRAAEEAARKAAQEAAERKAAEAAAREKAQGRYAAYGAPEEPPAPPKPVTAKLEPASPPKDEGILDKFKSLFGFGAPAAKEPVAKPEKPTLETAGTPPEPETPALPEAIQQEVDLAKAQAPELKADLKDRLAKPSEAERAERAKDPIDPDHQAVFDTLEPAEQQAFKELAPKSRADFNQVYQAVGGMWAEPTQYSKEASSGLRKLLQDGRLEAKDTEGQTLIGTLAKRAGQEVQPEMQAHSSAIGVLQSAIKQVAFPDRVFQGENTNTCASTALQGILANEDPAEFMRLATGLVFDGKVDLAGGKSLKLDAHEVGSVDGNRSALSQALQTSFDTFAKQFPPQSDADFGGGRVGGGGRYGGGRVGTPVAFGGGRVGGTDRFGGGRVGGTDRFGEGGVGGAEGQRVGGANGGQVDGGGLTQNQIEKLYENVVGRLAVNMTVDKDNALTTLDGVAAALGAGQKVPVGVQGVDDQGNATHHMISVLDIRKDAEDPGKDQVVFTDPGTGKPATMKVEDFARIMEAAIIPAQFADHMRWNVENKAADPFGGGRVGGGGGRLG